MLGLWKQGLPGAGWANNPYYLECSRPNERHCLKKETETRTAPEEHLSMNLASMCMCIHLHTHNPRHTCTHTCLYTTHIQPYTHIHKPTHPHSHTHTQLERQAGGAAVLSGMHARQGKTDTITMQPGEMWAPTWELCPPKTFTLAKA